MGGVLVWLLLRRLLNLPLARLIAFLWPQAEGPPVRAVPLLLLLPTPQ